MAREDFETEIDLKHLPIVYDCEGCGVCCMHMGTPPGFVYYLPRKGEKISKEAREREDYQIVKSLPAKLRAELRAYYNAVDRGELEDRTGYDAPCPWLDERTMRCKHYENRPTICREYYCDGHRYCPPRKCSAEQAKPKIKAERRRSE
jgi:Fe-S-cluster containining protein